ncbi:MAG: hypothetical protein LUQ19_02500 [Methanoregula sp.]|nr:hypothetical protein [Methanoregula sp.]
MSSRLLPCRHAGRINDPFSCGGTSSRSENSMPVVLYTKTGEEHTMVLFIIVIIGTIIHVEH